MADQQAQTQPKVALITGAGGRGGIGRAIATALAREGISLALTDLRRDADTVPPDEVAAGWRGIESVAEEARDLGVESSAHYCDLRDCKSIEALVAEVIARHGHVDILVNNARALMGQDARPVMDLPLEVWEGFLAINATAPFLMMRETARHMVERDRGGRIVSIGSDMSKRALPKTAAYAASKFALIGLTQAVAMDLAPHGITVNAVCPGPVRTNRFNYAEKQQADSAGLPLETVREQNWDRKGLEIPLGRPALPQEIADLVAYLVSEKAGYITGQAYNVNGGLFFH